MRIAIGGERQVRVIAGDEAVLEQRLQLLDQVGRTKLSAMRFRTSASRLHAK